MLLGSYSWCVSDAFNDEVKEEGGDGIGVKLKRHFLVLK